MRQPPRRLSIKTIFFVFYKHRFASLAAIGFIFFASFTLKPFLAYTQQKDNSPKTPGRSEILEQGTPVTGIITAIVDDAETKSNGRYAKVIYYTYPTSDSTTNNDMFITVSDKAYQLQIDDGVVVRFLDGFATIEGMKPVYNYGTTSIQLGLILIIILAILAGIIGIAALGYFIWVVGREFRVLTFGLSVEAEVVQKLILPMKETSLIGPTILVHYKYIGTTGQNYFGLDRTTEPFFAILNPGDKLKVLVSETHESFSILQPGQIAREGYE